MTWFRQASEPPPPGGGLLAARPMNRLGLGARVLSCIALAVAGAGCEVEAQGQSDGLAWHYSTDGSTTANTSAGTSTTKRVAADLPGEHAGSAP